MNRKWMLPVLAFVLVCVLFSGQAVEASQKQGTVTTTNSLNVRAEATTTSTIIGKLSLGDAVAIYQTKGEFHEIAFNGKRGFVHKDYITIHTSSTSSPNDISIYVNGKKLELPISTVPLVNDSVLVPFRVIGESLGIDVHWIEKSKQVVAKESGLEVLFTLNQEKTIVNNRTITVNPAPRTIESSTVIPLRFFAETFGADVSWNQAKKEVQITRKPQAAKPPESSVKGAYVGEVNRADTLNVRKGPGTEYASLGKMVKGERVQVVEFSDRWAKIVFNGTSGYVHSYYLDLFSDSGQLKMLGQPAVSEVGNATTITWPKIGGTVDTSHTQSGSQVTIQTNAVDFERLPHSVKGLEQVSYHSNSKGQTMTFTVASDYQVAVSHTVGELIVHVSENKIGQPGQTLSGKKIVIDPGHGGKDIGAPGNGLREKDIVLDVGLRVEKLLKEAGAHVIMTRDTDVYPTLGDRVKVANDAKADVFISIHTNAAESTAANGTETFWNAKYTAGESKRLAETVQKRLIEKLGTTDRKVKPGNFEVIRETKMPSVLLELAFISNASDAALLKTDSFRQKSAEAVYEGLVDFYR
ncbi:SH3 domain-containing protein [bacterium LRH843]|nr:SH3 domain-containing protein [bacterium LRH843]